MNLNKYHKLIDEINKKAEKEKTAISRRYAIYNNNVSIGDIVTDHIGKIKVESIKWTYDNFSRLPTCIYQGTKLKKDLSPYKSNITTSIYQSNIIDIKKGECDD